MEELLLALAQFLFEILFPFLAEIFVNLGIYCFPHTENTARIFVTTCFAGLLGYASGFIPSPIQNHLIIQMVVVVLGPFGVAGLMERIRLQTNFGRKFLVRYGSFWGAYVFSLAFLILRSLAIHHHTVHIY